MLSAYVGIEGFVLKRMYIVKEMSILYDSGETDHYRFSSPPDLMLSPAEAKTIRFASKHLNGISYHDGSVPYSEIGNVLDRLSGNFEIILGCFGLLL